MPTTPNYGWPTPANTGLVKDGASDMRSLGDAADATVKSVSDAQIPKTIVDAKGDIIAATANDTVARVAVGTNGQVLTADSTATAGVKWSTPSAGGYTLITSGSLSGAAIVLGSGGTLSQSYKDLRLVVRNYKPATDGAGLRFRFNNDNTANRHQGNATSVTTGTFTGTAINVGPPNDDTVATGLIVVDVPDYTNTATWKMLWCYAVGVNETTTTSFNMTTQIGLYNQVGAVTSIGLSSTSGNLTSGDYYLYGAN